jgi:hypothetical protein
MAPPRGLSAYDPAVGGVLTVLLAAGVASGDVAAAVARLFDAHGWGAPEREARLDEAAARVAARLADRPEAPAPEAPDAHVRFALQSLAVGDAEVRPFTVRYAAPGDLEARLPALLTRLDRRFPPTHFGVATAVRRGAYTTTIVAVHRGVTLDEPLPVTAAPGELIRLAGALRRGYFEPRVLFEPPGRPVTELGAAADDRRVHAALSFDAGPGAYGVELLADSRHGPVVLLNHRVWVGTSPPALPTVRVTPPPEDGTPPDKGLYDLVNLERVRSGAAPLVWDPRLAEVATAYAGTLRRLSTLAHDSSDEGTLASRLRLAGLRFERLAENLAEAEGPAAALDAFRASPGHKRNVVDPGLTHVGIGVAGRYFVVAFATWPKPPAVTPRRRPPRPSPRRRRRRRRACARR